MQLKSKCHEVMLHLANRSRLIGYKMSVETYNEDDYAGHTITLSDTNTITLESSVGWLSAGSGMSTSYCGLSLINAWSHNSVVPMDSVLRVVDRRVALKSLIRYYGDYLTVDNKPLDDLKEIRVSDIVIDIAGLNRDVINDAYEDYAGDVLTYGDVLTNKPTLKLIK